MYPEMSIKNMKWSLIDDLLSILSIITELQKKGLLEIQVCKRFSYTNQHDFFMLEHIKQILSP